MLLDAKLGYSIVMKEDWSYWLGAGFSRTRFEYDISDLNRGVVTSAYPGGVGVVSGKYREYEKTTSIPYLGSGFDMHLDRFSGSLSFGWSPVARVESEDTFIPYGTVYETEDSGAAYMAGIQAAFRLTGHVTLGFSFDYTKVNTDGERKEYSGGTFVRSGVATCALPDFLHSITGLFVAPPG